MTMTEADWLAAVDPMPMLEFVYGRVTGRKLRLLACHFCRQPEFWRLLPPGSRELVAAAERHVEGQASWAEVLAAAEAAPRGRASGGPWRSPNPVRIPLSSQAQRAARCLAAEDAWDAVWRVAIEGVNLLGPEACGLLRDLLGNLVRPSPPLAPAVLAWDSGTVPKLASAIYEERAFGRLPVLADALEDAGCTDAEVLGHCRGGGEHARGCWVVDLALGKG